MNYEIGHLLGRHSKALKVTGALLVASAVGACDELFPPPALIAHFSCLDLDQSFVQPVKPGQSVRLGVRLVNVVVVRSEPQQIDLQAEVRWFDTAEGENRQQSLRVGESIHWRDPSTDKTMFVAVESGDVNIDEGFNVTIFSWCQ